MLIAKHLVVTTKKKTLGVEIDTKLLFENHKVYSRYKNRNQALIWKSCEFS